MAITTLQNFLNNAGKCCKFVLLWGGSCSFIAAAAAAKSLQSCLTLCDPTDGSPPDFPIPGILQARPLEWIAISFSSAWKWKVKVNLLSHVRLFVTLWTATYQAPPSMGFSRQEYWSGVPLPSPGSSYSAWNSVTLLPVVLSSALCKILPFSLFWASTSEKH